MALLPKAPSRVQLERIAGRDFELIRALERLFEQALQLTPSEVAALVAGIDANSANIAANAGAIDQLEERVDNLTLNVTVVNARSDLPAAVGGVITLEAGRAYFITGEVDLLGDRLETGGIVAIIGTSSETAAITSTGLNPSTPLLTSRFSIPMRFLCIKDVGTGIYIDDNAGANAPLAVDWFGVNFKNVPTIGEVGTVDNFIYDTGAFLDSQGLSFTGTVGTVGFGNSIFSGDGTAGDIISVASTATITRRFRITYSSFVAFGSTVGLNVSTSATIPVEGYILDTVNFSGGGTYTAGVAFDDDKSRWIECRGIRNSAAISSYYMNGNATATVITVIGDAVKVAGTTTSAPITQTFTNSANRATYDGAIQRDFKVTAVLSCNSGNNNEVGIYIAKNGTLLPESEVYITTNAGGRAEAAMCQVLVNMVENDFIEIWVENDTSTTNITVTDLNVIVEAIN